VYVTTPCSPDWPSGFYAGFWVWGGERFGGW